MEKYQKKISEAINSSYPELDVIFTTPPDSRLGDISMPCFAFAKILRKSPNVIADELKSKLINLDFIGKNRVYQWLLELFYQEEHSF